jgi:hypothetical protein
VELVVGGARSRVHLKRHERFASRNHTLKLLLFVLTTHCLLIGFLVFVLTRLIGLLLLILHLLLLTQLLTQLILLLLLILVLNLRALHVRVRGDRGNRSIVRRTALRIPIGGVGGRLNAETGRGRRGKVSQSYVRRCG